MYRSILVPLDGSRFGEHALPAALKIAQKTAATIHLAHVHVAQAPIYAESALVYDDRVDAAIRNSERAYLESLMKRIGEVAPTVLVTCSLLDGAVGDALDERARAVNADLIVMTTHGRGAVARAWLGSVSDELVRRLPMPVLLILPHEARVDLTKTPAFNKVLIPLDGSPLAEQIIGPALALGKLADADYTLVRVVKPVVMGNYDLTEKPASDVAGEVLARLQTLHEEEKRQGARYLEELAKPLRERSLRVETRVLVHDQPAIAILDEVKSKRFDLVAIETHGRSGLPRVFLGSVADKILRGTSVPILVHKPKKKDGSE
jgi:nucleotide-binding universal stress UspA family protein